MRRQLAAALVALLLFSAPALADAFSSLPGMTPCGILKGVNLNSTLDQQINFTPPAPTYVPLAIRLVNPSTSMSGSAAAGGIYSGVGKTGTLMVAASQAYTGLTSTAANTPGNFMVLTLTAANYNLSTWYFSLTTAHGSASTVDLYMYCYAHP
jgi:hypothetical protein